MSSGRDSHERYRGRLGATRREHVHYACPCGAHHAVEVVAGIDAQADGGLARRLVDGDPTFNSAVCGVTRQRTSIAVPVLYHDPVNRLFVLVLDEADRWRELGERARLYQRMAEDTEVPVPAYAVRFGVVYGAAGLRRYLDNAAERARTITPTPAPVARRQPSVEERTEPLTREDLITAEQAALAPPAPPVARWPGGRETALRRVTPDGGAQLLVRAGRAELAELVGDRLEVRIQLHRLPNFPLVTLALGSPEILQGAAGQPFWVPLDVAGEADRALLTALGRSFELVIETYDRDSGDALAHRRELTAPLADNARAALAAAGDYLKSIPVGDRSFARALASFWAPDHDRLGLGSLYAADFDDGALDRLDGPAAVVRAARVVRRFSEPAAEDWLVLVRGYSMERWHARRRAVVERAVELGIWPGPVAAQIAVGEGMARSRKELVVRLQRSFANLVGGEHGIEDAAVRGNWESLKGEAAALGLPPTEWSAPRSEPIVSEAEPVASGQIGQTAEPVARAAPGGPAAPANGNGGTGDPRVSALAADALVAMLGQRERRLIAAIELCRRGDPAAIRSVFGTIEGMSRAEAGRVLGHVVGFRREGEPHLLALLESRKGFLRQGAALALAVLKSEVGLEACCDLLLDEPTEIWREVARALGESGEAAVLPLAARLSQRPASTHERAAWAMAHIAARGGKRAIEALAAGRDPVAAGVARHALELVDLARSDHLQVRGERMPRDQTVNRAFSRQFFAAMAAEPATIGTGIDGSGSMLLLDESDVLEAMDVDGDESELDEKDLMPT